MARFDEDDFDVSGKNRSIAQLLGTLYGFIAGTITGLVVGVAFVGGPLGVLAATVGGLFTGSILGYVIATLSTGSPGPRGRERHTFSQVAYDSELKKGSYSAGMGPLQGSANKDKAGDPAPEFSGPQVFDLRKSGASTTDVTQNTDVFSGPVMTN